MTAPLLSLVLPCFNEAPHLRWSARRISWVLDRAGFTSELVFVDDGSSDGTRELLPAVCRELPSARYVLHARNRGRGGAVKTGVQSSSGRVVGYIDIDLEAPAEVIPPLVRVVAGGDADVCTGRRTYALTQLRALHRVALSRGYSALSRAVLGLRARDTESGCKFFRRETAAPVIAACESDGWFFDTEVMVRAERAGLAVRELPIPFVRRREKASTVRIARDVAHYLRHLYRLRRQMGSP